MTKPIPLQSFRLKNFKAVRDSGTIKFGPLTVFIGDNGSGKSSVVEGLETLQAIAVHDLDTTKLPWGNRTKFAAVGFHCVKWDCTLF